jgi:hypothetical protein
LADGTATGIITAEIMNWTGQALSAPRTRFEDAIKRDELKRTGVYILIGETLEDEITSVYVGEGDDISQRLRSHANDSTKDFWDRFIAFTSKDMNLTKAHVKYLEARLIDLLHNAKKSKVENKTAPTFDKLPEADIADMETYLDEMQLVLPVIGIDVFRKPRAQVAPEESQKNLVFQLVNKSKGIDAKAMLSDGTFLLLKDSIGSLETANSFRRTAQERRELAKDAGIIQEIDAHNFEVIEDIEFKSPSGAADFLFGMSRNGRTDWKVEGQSLTYADWETEKLRDNI